MYGLKLFSPQLGETQHFRDDNLPEGYFNEEHLNFVLMALKSSFKPTMIFKNGIGWCIRGGNLLIRLHISLSTRHYVLWFGSH